MLAIEMVGGVYCPLSPRDPQHRLHALMQQTQNQLVLVHHLTKTKFDHDIMLVNIDIVLINNNVNIGIDIGVLSSTIFSPKNIAYIIFTSGSTGTPKAVRRNRFYRLRLEFEIFFVGSSDTSQLYHFYVFSSSCWYIEQDRYCCTDSCLYI
jgi:non-ribosomal peptide synthetase component F